MKKESGQIALPPGLQSVKCPDCGRDKPARIGTNPGESGQNLYLGADPGVSGSLVIVSRSTQVKAHIPLSVPINEVANFLRKWEPRVRRACVERVRHISGDGPKGSFTFGQSYGEIRALFEALIPGRWIEVTPTAWRTRMGFRLGQDKTTLLRRAKSLCPDFPFTKINCDAYLIALFIMQKENRDHES